MNGSLNNRPATCCNGRFCNATRHCESSPARTAPCVRVLYARSQLYFEKERQTSKALVVARPRGRGGGGGGGGGVILGRLLLKFSSRLARNNERRALVPSGWTSSLYARVGRHRRRRNRLRFWKNARFVVSFVLGAVVFGWMVGDRVCRDDNCSKYCLLVLLIARF